MRVVLPTYRTNAHVTNFTVTGDSINKNTFYNILLFSILLRLNLLTTAAQPSEDIGKETGDNGISFNLNLN
jgi:hypothetical protein